MSRGNSPCKDCEFRSVGCHDRCNQYQDFKSARNRFLEKNAEEKQLNNISRDLHFNSIKKKCTNGILASPKHRV